GARVVVERAIAVEAIPVLDELGPEAAACAVVGGAVRADRDARRRRGRARRRAPMLYIRHRLMLTPQTPLFTAERARPTRPAGRYRSGSGLAARASAAAADLSDPPAHPRDAGGRRVDLPGPTADARRRRVGVRQVPRREPTRAGRVLRGGGQRPALVGR